MHELGFSLAGLLVGIAVGATGVGGGSLMTPVLIVFYGVSPALAVGTDLLYASISKAFGVALHGRNGSLDWRIVWRLALGSVPAAFLTLRMVSELGHTQTLDQLIKITLSCAILVTASFTLFQERLLRTVKDHHRARLQRHVERLQLPLTVASGALVGAVVTISSVGAGVIGMMLLMLLYPRHAPIRLVGSDLAHAVLITAIAGIGHARLGSVDYAMLGALLLGALPGIWLGSRIGFRLDGLMLKRVIAGLLLLVGSSTLFKAIGPMMMGPVADADAHQQNAGTAAR
jgi:uncharacterized membrane protein YfcA